MRSAEGRHGKPLSKGQCIRVVGWVGKQENESSSLGHTLGFQDIDKVQDDIGCPGKGAGFKEHVHYDAGTHLGGKKMRFWFYYN